MPLLKDITGLTHHGRGSFAGYTLFSPAPGRHACLLDHGGRVVHQWFHDGGLQHIDLLDDGNLLCQTRRPERCEGNERIGGSAAALVELDADSNVVWRHDDPYMHHDYARLENGNTLYLRWEKLPPDVAARVQGGYVADDDPDWMWGDVVREIDRDGAVVREWRSWEHLSPDHHVKCPLESRKEWTHANSISVTPDGRWLVSFRLTDTVVLVDPVSGAITWRWGPGEISHQHDAQWLDNGHVLLFDNGTHRRGMPSFSRVVEVDPATKTIVWSHVDEPILATFSFMVGGCQRLPNGNTFFVEGATGRMVEVTPKGTIVWEWISPWLLPTLFGLAGVVFRAFRIAPSDQRLAGLALDADRYAHVNELFASGRRLDHRDEARMARAVGHRLTRRTPPKPE